MQYYKDIKEYTQKQEQDMLWSMFDDIWPQHQFEDIEWFKQGKKSFSETDWEKEVENFRLNNDGASKALVDFAKSLSNN